MPPVAGLDLARVGLGAISRVPLLLGGAGPLNPGQAGGEGLIIFNPWLVFVALARCFLYLFVGFFLGSSADTLSGWTEYLHALCTEIGG